MERPSIVTSVSPKDWSSARRSGFTLVELLAVIMIIALLAGLVTPAVMRARNSARNAATKAEIDMLHMAIMNYKNEYGSFPPCYVPSVNGSDAASRHLRRLFPRMPQTDVVGQVQSLAYLNNGTSWPAMNAMGPGAALVTWLFGYTGDTSSPVMTANFSVNNGQASITGGTPQPRKKLFDFDVRRLNNFTYAPAGKPGAGYLYIDFANYAYYTANPLSASGGSVKPEVDSTSAFFNADTFQILCAGDDETWGTDDDLSNFWKGTRKQYLDSLKQ